ncbi:MAG TPA: transcriptional repressor LexA, partial [Candidatus Eisenbacteria bacterium]|nr:transcriptional repressor LexA [Candidatus Eisenbacteria bacterium]
CSFEQYMYELTQRQKQVLDFIQTSHHAHGLAPSLREIASHFGFRSMTAAAHHVRALRHKGALHNQPHCARALRVLSPLHHLRKRVADIPIYGVIPAGFADDRRQEAKGCVSIDIETLGVKPTPRTFALEVRGDSMIGKHIVEGDLVVLEHGQTPRPGDVVAALIDNESTLKTFVMDKGKPCLRAENPRYPKLIPASELVIQGVMVALIRKSRRQKAE